MGIQEFTVDKDDINGEARDDHEDYEKAGGDKKSVEAGADKKEENVEAVDDNEVAGEKAGDD